MDGVSVWEWYNHGYWIPYSHLVCKHLESALLNRKRSFQLGDVEPLLRDFKVVLTKGKFRQEGTSTKSGEYKVRRCFYPMESAPGYGVTWCWYNTTNYEPYAMEVQCVLEELYDLGLDDVHLGVVFINLPYKIDFVNMTQTNQDSGFCRNLRRTENATHKYPLVKLQPHEYLEKIRSPSDLVTLGEIHKATPRINRPPAVASKAEAARFFTSTQRSIASGSSDFKTSNDTRAEENERATSMEIDNEDEYNLDTSKFGVLLRRHGNIVKVWPTEQEYCCICCSEFNEPSPYGSNTRITVALSCKHMIHVECLRQYVNVQSGDTAAITCPVCKTVYGSVQGTQPKNGVMTHTVINTRLPGYKDCRTIQITYDFSSGIQGPEHPNPGQPYSAHGFPRVAYLPNNEKGKQVLKLLEKAWESRLLFTVGESVTTKVKNTITWNDIHHKTSTSEGSFGYPDPHYLDRVLQELAAHGVQ